MKSRQRGEGDAAPSPPKQSIVNTPIQGRLDTWVWKTTWLVLYTSSSCDDWHEQYRIAADICHTATNVTIKSKHVMDRKNVNKIATGGSLYTCHCRHRQTVFYVLLGFNASWLMVHKSRATFFIFHQEQYVALSITIVTPAWPWMGVESGGSVRFQEMRPGCTIRGWSRQVLLALFWLVFHE